jgi:predicted RNase H-like nuclease
LKEVFLDSALAGLANVDRVISFKEKEKKKKHFMDLNVRFVAF